MTEHEDRLVALAYTVKDSAQKITEIHAVLFGVQGKGGFLKMVEDHECELRDLLKHKNKAMGAIAVISVLCGALGAVIARLIK